MNRASCLYDGRVRHRRFWPVANHFQYRLTLLYLDLAELPTLFADCRFWSADRVNLAYFRRRDHFGDPEIPLDQAVRRLVAAEIGLRLDGPIRLLTHLRYFGYCFNPASFYFCYDRAGQEIRAIIVEIHNTPWGEVHCYVFDPRQSLASAPNHYQFRLAKNFHVSPFMPMDITYDWRFTRPGRQLQVHFISQREKRPIFDATLTLTRRDMTPAALNRLLWSCPPLTFKVITLIYWQAARLWLKGAPFHIHPRKLARRGVR